MDILINQLDDGKSKDGALAIQIGLVDRYNEMAKEKWINKAKSSVNLDDGLVRDKKSKLKGATDSDHIPDLGGDVNISDDDENQSVSLGDASDDEFEIDETFDPNCNMLHNSEFVTRLQFCLWSFAFS